MTTGPLQRDEEGGVVTLRLNRPERRNALTTELLGLLGDELRSIADGPRVRAVVVTGAGPVFCAGADLHEFPPGSPPEGGLRRVRLVSAVVDQLRNLEQPTIAVVSGAAYGAGWGLALACDLTYAAADARFSLPELRRGLRLPPTITARLVEVVGPVRAAEVVLGGEVHDVEAGHAAGWVGRVFPDPDQAAQGAAELARHLAEVPRPAVTTVKQVFRRRQADVAVPPPEYAWNEE